MGAALPERSLREYLIAKTVGEFRLSNGNHIRLQGFEPGDRPVAQTRGRRPQLAMLMKYHMMYHGPKKPSSTIPRNMDPREKLLDGGLGFMKDWKELVRLATALEYDISEKGMEGKALPSEIPWIASGEEINKKGEFGVPISVVLGPLAKVPPNFPYSVFPITPSRLVVPNFRTRVARQGHAPKTITTRSVFDMIFQEELRRCCDQTSFLEERERAVQRVLLDRCAASVKNPRSPRLVHGDMR